MNIKIVDQSYFVEIPLSVNPILTQIYYFPVLENLNGKLTQGISFYSPTVLARTQQNVPVSNNNVLKSSYLTLVIGAENQIWNIPVIDLITVTDGSANVASNPFAIEFNNLPVIWAKSYIYVANTALIAATQESYAINIMYTDR